MKPVLVIGLGNTLMGDDGVGCRAVELLAADPRLPADVEAVAGGTDLLRFFGEIEGRRRVVVVDAVEDDSPPGTVAVLDAGLDERQDHAHHLSAVQAVKLLQLAVPARFTLLGISISSARLEEHLSPALSDKLPEVVDQVLELLK